MKNEIRYKTITYDVMGQTAKNLDEFLESGYYLLELTHGVGDLGLPVGDCSNNHYMVAHLLVSDSGTVSTLQEGRMVGQTLILTNAAGAATRVYTRTAEFSKSGTLWSAWVDLGAAVTSDIQDGAITVEKLSSAVREKVDNPLRPLFIAAGAEYNDSGSDKTKTAPWGEQVTHKAAHYYLNGLGDITEEQMIEIYDMKDTLNNIRASSDAQRWFQNNMCECRTFFPMKYATRRTEFYFIKNGYSTFHSSKAEALKWTTEMNFSFYGARISGECEAMFMNMTNLRFIDNMDFSQSPNLFNAFSGCSKLEHFRIGNLKTNILFQDSAIVSKDSIKYIITKASPASAITITLHPDAYTRLANDTDIVAALQAQPLVTLVSA